MSNRIIRTVRFTVGMIAGLCDLAGNTTIRNRISSMVAHDGAFLDGFDVVADLAH